MTVKEFWEDDPALFWSYRSSFIQKKKNEQLIANQVAWLQGAYIYDAVSKSLANAFSKNKKYQYIDKPFDLEKGLTSKEEIEEKAQKSTSYWASLKERLSKERE